MALQGGSIIVLLLTSQSLRLNGRAGPELLKENLNVVHAGASNIGLLYRVEPKPEQTVEAFQAEVETVMGVVDAVEWY